MLKRAPLYLLAFLFLLSAQNGSSQTSTPERLKIVPNGEFRAQHGLFFIEGNRLDVYSALPTVLSEKTHQWEPVPNDDEMAQWKGEPFYYQRFHLEQDKWVLDQKVFSKGPSAYLDFGPCDPADQIDLPSAEFKKVLPAGAKIKNITTFADYATVVFAQHPKQPFPRYSLDAYSLAVSLLVRTGSAWQVHQAVDVGADGFFCGTRTLPAKLADGSRGTVLLLYTDEPAASSNYRAIHSFIATSSAAIQNVPRAGAESENASRPSGRSPAGGENALPLPEKLVQAVGDSESGLNPRAIHVIPRIEDGAVLLDALGKPIPDTVNYGLMQINSVNIGKTVVKDENGEPFTITEDVRTDWKANARAGVALLAQQYQLAKQEQGIEGTEETCALQTYSGYNGGTRNRRRYREKN